MFALQSGSCKYGGWLRTHQFQGFFPSNYTCRIGRYVRLAALFRELVCVLRWPVLDVCRLEFTCRNDIAGGKVRIMSTHRLSHSPTENTQVLYICIDVRRQVNVCAKTRGQTLAAAQWLS